MLFRVYTRNGICARNHCGAEPPRDIEPPWADPNSSVGEVERQLRMPQPTGSRHLRVLRAAGFVESTVDASAVSTDGTLNHFRRGCLAGSIPSVLVRLRGCSQMPSRPNGSIITHEKEDKEKKMTDLEQYTPGPAGGAQVRKDGEKWTLYSFSSENCVTRRKRSGRL